MKNLILASTSTIHGSEFLSYLLSELALLYKGVPEVLFIPYARPSGISYTEYTSIVKKAFAKSDLNVVGIHEYEDPIDAIMKAKGLYVGGGNTFMLVNELYKHKLMFPLKKQIELGVPYLGTSAGTNICGLTMQTTNDMPIVYPPSFDTFGCIPYNLNVHYLDVNPKSKHKGETRETRIREFQKENNIDVIGLREGSWIRVENGEMKLEGPLKAILFQVEKDSIEIRPGHLF